VAHRNHSDGLAILERNVRLPFRVGECGDPLGASRVSGELTEVWWEDVLETRDRRSTRDPKTQLGVLHRRTHDPHARRKYCGQRSSTSSRLREPCRPKFEYRRERVTESAVAFGEASP
jgi:hypothetical protein